MRVAASATECASVASVLRPYRLVENQIAEYELLSA
jgi:hypothetical protein